VPSFSHSIELSQPPEAVFPWLLEEDKVPQWTSDLQSYSVEGRLGEGAQVRQSLNLAGGLRVTMEIVRYDPPRGAETRFETNGVKVTSAYVLEPAGAGTRLTLSHTVAGDDWVPKVAAGWHICLDVAERLLDGQPVAPIRGEDAMQHGWQALHDAYAERLGTAAR
jgi:uncharacterized protein YndB with AHSA1/START domain